MFDLDMLSRVPIAFDIKKLLWLNRRYIHDLPQDAFTGQMTTFLTEVKDLKLRNSRGAIIRLIAAAPSDLKRGVDTMRDYAILVDDALSYKVPRFVGANCYGWSIDMHGKVI